MVVGASPIPTRYTATVGGIPLFVRCGADLLLTGRHVDLRADARCPVCGGHVSFEMARGALVNVRPRSAILHVVEETVDPRGRGIRCDETHIFDSRECLRAWLGRGPHLRGSDWALDAYLEHVRVFGIDSARAPGT